MLWLVRTSTAVKTTPLYWLINGFLDSCTVAVTNGKIDIQKGCFLVFIFALESKVIMGLMIPGGQESGTADALLLL